MALANPVNDQKAGAPLSLVLNPNSNNPFLNPRTGSPAIPSPSITGPQSASQPKSNNPFLASFESDPTPPQQTRTMESPTSSTQQSAIGEDAKEMFKRLTVADSDSIDDKSTTTLIATPRRKPTGETRRSDDRDRRSTRAEDTQYRKGPNGLRIPIRQPTNRQPERDRPRRSGSRDRRPRRNSDSEKQPTEEERREREKRRREREARNREREVSRDGRAESTRQSSSRKPRRPNAHVDVVDKLDVTGLYGVGGMWHHDGPFDACRPVRNNKKNTLAPMNAFPANSANNTIGGSGPVNQTINLQQFHGLVPDAFHDYSNPVAQPGPAALPASSAKQFAPAVVNPINRVEPVHGEETMGLGTSTFLDGAPASRAAIQRTQSEQDGLLTRKKSIAMRLRGMSGSRRYPEGYTGPMSPPLPNKPPGLFGDNGLPLSPEAAPRPSTAGARIVEKNPFDSLIEVGDDENRPDTLAGPSSGGAGGSKFLSRVKSLKGNRKRGDSNS